jgi:hypothetical protein
MLMAKLIVFQAGGHANGRTGGTFTVRLSVEGMAPSRTLPAKLLLHDCNCHLVNSEASARYDRRTRQGSRRSTLPALDGPRLRSCATGRGRSEGALKAIQLPQKNETQTTNLIPNAPSISVNRGSNLSWEATCSGTNSLCPLFNANMGLEGDFSPQVAGSGKV